MDTKIDIEQRAEKAKEYFSQGYNCCQSVVLAYSDIVELDNQTIATITAPFGGGMGRLQEVCGTVTGMFMVAGFIHKAPSPIDKAARKQTYNSVQLLAAEFTESNGSIICRELLISEKQRRKTCKALVGEAARIVGKTIGE